MVQRVMSEYMAAMEGVVDCYGGYVNKYVGDEIVAVFGFPRNEKDTVNRAVRAALAMLEKLDRLKEKWVAEGLPPLEPSANADEGAQTAADSAGGSGGGAAGTGRCDVRKPKGGNSGQIRYLHW